MPRLPELIDQRRPAPSPAGGAADITPVDTRSVGAIDASAGGDLRQAAAALGTGARDLANAVRQEQERIDRLQVESAVNKARAEQQRLTDEMLGVRGEDAMNGRLSEVYGEKLKTSLGKIANDLGTEAQREAFARRGEVVSLQFGGDILNHVRGETDATQKATHLATVQGETEQAIRSHADDGAVKLSIETIRRSTRDLADVEGWSKKTLDAVLEEQVSEVHVGVIEHKLVVDPGGAKEYYAANKGEVRGSGDRTKIEKSIRIADLQQRGQADADRIMGQVDPNSEQWAQESAAALERARAIRDPARREEAVARVKNRLSEISALRVQETNQHIDAAWEQALRGGEVPPPVIEHLLRRAPTKWKSIRDYLEAGEPAVSSPGTKAMLWREYRRAAAGAPGSTDRAAFLERDLRDLYPQLQTADRDSWHAKQAMLEGALASADAQAMEKAQKDAEVSRSYSNVRGVVDNQLLAAGIDPTPSTTADAEKLTVFEDRLFSEVEAWHLANPGKKMPESVVLEITRGLLSVTQEGGAFWNPLDWIDWQSEIRAFEADALDEIPEAAQKAIRADILEAGREPTPGLMLYLWRETQRRR